LKESSKKKTKKTTIEVTFESKNLIEPFDPMKLAKS